MNKNIKLAVAGAVLALSATANAGIIIPAGEWTLDVNGNVNAFGSYVKGKGVNTAGAGGLATGTQGHEDQTQSINTGLLPAWLGFTGKTRQNDLDVEFTISMQPGVSENQAHGDSSNGVGGTGVNSSFLNRQTYVSFGDKSWGSIKLGKDIGIFASDAILNDMTLLGVGAGAASSGAAANTTLGGIGSGYIYAAWKGQIAYTTPNFNGLQATVGITNPNQSGDPAVRGLYQDRFGLEAKASYSFSGDLASGKLWVSGLSNDVTYGNLGESYTATVADIGLNLNAGNLGLTGYYYTGEGVGTTVVGNLAHDLVSNNKRDSDGGYLQATYVLPTKTKLGIAYGTSNLDRADALDTAVISKNERITIGAYHPLTKHLNLVAEYNDGEAKAHSGSQNKARTGALGAILFF